MFYVSPEREWQAYIHKQVLGSRRCLARYFTSLARATSDQQRERACGGCMLDIPEPSRSSPWDKRILDLLITHHQVFHSFGWILAFEEDLVHLGYYGHLNVILLRELHGCLD